MRKIIFILSLFSVQAYGFTYRWVEGLSGQTFECPARTGRPAQQMRYRLAVATEIGVTVGLMCLSSVTDANACSLQPPDNTCAALYGMQAASGITSSCRWQDVTFPLPAVAYPDTPADEICMGHYTCENANGGYVACTKPADRETVSCTGLSLQVCAQTENRMNDGFMETEGVQDRLYEIEEQTDDKLNSGGIR